MSSLRDYQDEAVGCSFEEWAKPNVVNTLVVIPTGAGKTATSAEVIRRFQPQRAMFLVHREELVWQTRKTLERFVKLDCGIEMGDLRISPSLFGECPVVISTVQTLNSAMGDRSRMTKFNPMEFGVLVVDEAQHSPSKTWRKVIDYMRRNPNLKVLSLSATPTRHDEIALGQVVDSVAYDYDLLDAIQDGWLVPIEQNAVTVKDLDFSHIRTTAGDLNSGELAAVMEAERALQGVAGPLIDIVGDRQTLVFAASVKQAQMLSDILNRHKRGSSAWACGKTPKEERQQIVRDFAEGRYQFNVNCDLWSEGYDVPQVQVIGMAAPTESEEKYRQRVGRATRALPGVVDNLPGPTERRAAIQYSNKPYCVAEGQKVLTDHGLVPIEMVTKQMKVWDGLTFVNHGGSVFRGQKKVITYAGITATADHQVWTKTGWKTLGQCALEQASISVTEIGGEAVREAEGCFRRGVSRQREGAPDNRVSGLRREVLQGIHFSSSGKCGMPEVRASSARAAVAGEEVHLGKVQVLEQELRRIPWIWRSGNSVQVQNTASYGDVDSEESWSGLQEDYRQNRQRWSLPGWESPLGKEVHPKQQQERKSNNSRVSSVSTSTSFGGILGRPPKEAVEEWGELGRYTYQAPPQRALLGKVRVFDILNAGPRHRFTVSGLLVSNCEIVDFAGNAGKHKLISTADLLGGRVCDEAIDRAKVRAKKAGEQGKSVRMSEVLKEEQDKLVAEREERRLKEVAETERLIAKVQYSTRRVDPFDAFDISPVRQRGWNMGSTQVVDVKLANLLRRQGIDPSNMSKAEATKISRELFRRWRAKICTANQAALLKKHYPDLNTRELKLADASKMIDQLKQNGWKAVQPKDK